MAGREIIPRENLFRISRPAERNLSGERQGWIKFMRGLKHPYTQIVQSFYMSIDLLFHAWMDPSLCLCVSFPCLSREMRHAYRVFCTYESYIYYFVRWILRPTSVSCVTATVYLYHLLMAMFCIPSHSIQRALPIWGRVPLGLYCSLVRRGELSNLCIYNRCG